MGRKGGGQMKMQRAVGAAMLILVVGCGREPSRPAGSSSQLQGLVTASPGNDSVRVATLWNSPQLSAGGALLPGGPQRLRAGVGGTGGVAAPPPRPRAAAPAQPHR